MPQRTWTPTEDAYLIAERTAGRPVPEIAAELTRGVPTTYLRCKKLGLIRQIHTPWTPELVERLIALATGEEPRTLAEIARETGKPADSVRWKIADLKLVTTISRVTAARTSRSDGVGKRGPSADRKVRRREAEEATRVRASESAAERQTALEAERKRASDEKRRIAAERRLAADAARAARRAASAIEAQAKRDALAEARRQAAEARRVQRQQQVDLARKAKAHRAGETRLAEERLKRAREIEVARATAAPRPKPLALSAIGIAPLAAAPLPPQELAVSGRGGWRTVARRGRPRSGPAPTRDETMRLSLAAGAAVARFERERGFTRPVEDPVEALVTYLRRRGYVVLAETDNKGRTTRWTVDHRHRLVGPSALRQFAEARGYA